MGWPVVVCWVIQLFVGSFNTLLLTSSFFLSLLLPPSSPKSLTNPPPSQVVLTVTKSMLIAIAHRLFCAAGDNHNSIPASNTIACFAGPSNHR
ncbi:hypothetical protein HanXRQr2_Chr16g0737541 [Helianthus annuus]|uniref:Uncharacterized protein n=1 Tax=Helianthus annuus TaxID=4232 RepID=A0A9K3GXX1_HELAN|nr:hypothetical protein HanXRQr2_Chr16g0737541 [Helianthus annuus]